MKSSLHARINKESSGMEIAHLITQFEAYLLTEKRVSHNTLAAYRTDIHQFVSFLAKNNITFATISQATCKEFMHYLYESKLSARSIGRKIAALKLFFRYLNRQYNYKNCAAELVTPAVDHKLPRYLKEDEISHLLKVATQDTSAAGIRNSAILYLLYASGMRISELTMLKISDIQFSTACIMVQGKGGRQRLVPVPTAIITIIERYLKHAYKNITHQISMPQGTDYLFPAYYGKKVKAISRQAFWIILKKLCHKAGIMRSVSPHQLRHSLATHMLKNGIDLRSLQMLLGHENLATVEIYTHVEKSHVRKIYDKKHIRS